MVERVRCKRQETAYKNDIIEGEKQMKETLRDLRVQNNLCRRG